MEDRNITFNPKLFNPLYWHLMPLLRDTRIRFIFIEGGSSAAKTFSICQAILNDSMEHRYNTMVFRRFHVHIKDSVYSSFKEAAKSLQIDSEWKFQEDVIKNLNSGNHIRFRGLDDEENIKGIEGYNVVYNNEWSQFQEKHFDQQRKRLRGRANQKFICDWNPISSKLWQYENFIDRPDHQWQDLPLDMPDAPTKYSGFDPDYSFKRINKAGNAVWMKITFRSNFFVVGHPSGKGGFLDVQTLLDFESDRIYKPNLYRVYANGERGIMRTGGEFWKQFNELRDVAPVAIKPGSTLHVSLDQNVNPYVTISIWQLQLRGEGCAAKQITQIHEIPCKTPENNAVKSAMRLSSWLRAINYKDLVLIYGDPAGNARSMVDENNASFYDKFIEVMQREGFTISNKVGRSAPEVALSGTFINEIYENGYAGYTIKIGDACKVSIDDYLMSKEDKDGKMLKEKIKDPTTGITYEPYGHFSDAKRYFITTLLQAEFNQYKARGSKYRIQTIEQ